MVYCFIAAWIYSGQFCFSEKEINQLKYFENNFSDLQSYFGRENAILKFVYSEKAAKFCEISTLLLSRVHTDKCKVEISQNFVAFSEYMNFNVKV